MNDRLRDAVRMYQIEIIAAAETKLGRSLSVDERAGIERISSLMTLESVCRSFAFPDYSIVQVEADLRHFAQRA